ncbi:PRC-barrel domain-containing protein [Paracoccus acridae]|nr:PRC-barrel domain-containing protein [Paracoccus acridae]
MRATQMRLLMAASALASGLAGMATAQEAKIEAEIVPLADWRYDELYTNGISVDDMIGSDVKGPTGDDIGDVENVLIGQDGQVLSVVAEVGGFFELGDTHVNIPWDMVEASKWDDGIEIPFTQETIEDFTLFTDEVVTASDATSDVEEVEGDGAGVVDTGRRVWRAGELIGDYARLKDGDGFANYGYIDDLIVRDGKVAAVVVSPDVGWGGGGYYAYPYYGYDHGWNPGSGFYDLPYERDEVEALEPFDIEQIHD